MNSAGDYGRKKLRECEGLVDSLIYLVRSSIERANIDNKSVENAVCVLRNLSYRSQEVEDPNYDKRQLPAGESRAAAKPNSDNVGCFGASKAKGGGKGGGGVSGTRVVCAVATALRNLAIDQRNKELIGKEESTGLGNITKHVSAHKKKCW